jgi:hypothetical protein
MGSDDQTKPPTDAENIGRNPNESSKTIQTDASSAIANYQDTDAGGIVQVPGPKLRLAE